MPLASRSGSAFSLDDLRLVRSSCNPCHLCYATRPVRIDAFDFSLPQELIAQRPAEPRDASRLLVVDPVEDSFTDSVVSELSRWLEPGSLLVVNDTRVIPARLLGRKADTGGRTELLLVRKVADEPEGGPGAEQWRAMGKASKAFKFPTRVLFGDPVCMIATLMGRAEDGLLEVVLEPQRGLSVREVLVQVGHVPLPPYIRRDDDDADRETYQTVFASQDGAVAAPTAGLHLTHRLIGSLSMQDVKIATVTLHVGLGTFLPVSEEDLDAHRMHEEWYDVPRYTARQIADARANGKPVVAVGTTSVRALESAADPANRGLVVPGASRTKLLIQPGYDFRVVDALLTNFHLPRSTLLALVASMAGRRRMLDAYAHAVREKYRFFSYGDAMLIRRCALADRGER